MSKVEIHGSGTFSAALDTILDKSIAGICETFKTQFVRRSTLLDE